MPEQFPDALARSAYRVSLASVVFSFIASTLAIAIGRGLVRCARCLRCYRVRRRLRLGRADVSLPSRAAPRGDLGALRAARASRGSHRPRRRRHRDGRCQHRAPGHGRLERAAGRRRVPSRGIARRARGALLAEAAHRARDRQQGVARRRAGLGHRRDPGRDRGSPGSSRAASSTPVGPTRRRRSWSARLRSWSRCSTPIEGTCERTDCRQTPFTVSTHSSDNRERESRSAVAGTSGLEHGTVELFILLRSAVMRSGGGTTCREARNSSR